MSENLKIFKKVENDSIVSGNLNLTFKKMNKK